jgi:hypothetical protein
MSTMEPDEGTQSEDRQDAPRWDKTEAANAPRWDEAQQPDDRADAPRWDEVQETDDRADAPRWDDVPQTSAEDAGLNGTDTSADS